MKKIFFLSGLPRAGNTLFGSLINQNKNIKVGSNTILTDVIFKLNAIKDYDIFHNFPDHASLDNVINNVFLNYYKNWNCDYIIDRGAWGTPTNLMLLKKIIKKPKFIILYRPILECLASFIKIEKPIDVEKRCHVLMNLENESKPSSGLLAKYLWSIKNIIKENEDHLIINYTEFIENPKKAISDVSKFIGVPLKLNKNIEQFKINSISYQDNRHTIRTSIIKKNKYSIEKYLSNKIIKTYSNLDIINEREI